MKLHVRRKLHLIQLAHWMAHQNEYLDHRKLTTRAHAEGRRMISQEAPRKEVYCKSFRYMAAKYWNDLPTHIHELSLIDKDEQVLKKRTLELICGPMNS